MALQTVRRRMIAFSEQLPIFACFKPGGEMERRLLCWPGLGERIWR